MKRRNQSAALAAICLSMLGCSLLRSVAQTAQVSQGSSTSSGSTSAGSTGSGAPSSSAAPTASCEPSCYPPEEPAKAADKVGCGYYTKGMCERWLGTAWGEAEVNQGASVGESIPSCKFPSAPRSGKWVQLSNQARQQIDVEPGDVVFIPPESEWESTTVGDEQARCVDVRWYMKTAHFNLTTCGEIKPEVVCEASGSNVARGLNMLHYRVEEAKKAQSTEKTTCQKAAHEAIALSRGLPRFKQQLTTSGDWGSRLVYHTRYEGTLNEQQVFAKVATLGKEATTLFKACEGTDTGTTETEEMSFRTK